MPESSAHANPLKIDQETLDRIDRIAESRQRTPHWIVNEAIVQYLEREEKRDVVRHDVVNAWEEYSETGLHVTGEEVITWLETWGEENERPAPTCHK
jgi:predicted transcriptional regulator